MGMEKTMDAGPILLQEPFDLEYSETAGSLHDKIAAQAATLLASGIRKIQAGTLQPTFQDEALATYCGKLTKEDARLSWHDSAVDIDRQVRAMNPYPGAFTEYQGQRVKVFGGQIVDALNDPNESGTVLRVGESGIVVAGGDGAYAITELQMAGKKRLPVDVFLRGQDVCVGDRFE